MPSFVAANSGSAIDARTTLASRFSIKVSAYKAAGSSNPSSAEFAVLLQDFDAFCETNKNSTCDMLMLTGYHGEYGDYGMFNNLSREQLTLLVQTAEKHKVVFKHIVADCCCAAFGLKQLEGMLANGGEAIGDRMTSTAHKMHDKLIEKMIKVRTDNLPTEQSLINTVISESMLTFNAPLYITKNNNTITAAGTTETEVRKKLVQVYKDTGMVDSALSDEEAKTQLRAMGLDYDLNMITRDFRSSNNLFTISEKTERAELLTLRKQHFAPKEELTLEKMKETDIDALHVLDQRVFPDETPLGKDRLLNVCKKGMSFVIRSSKTNGAIGYVFVNPVGNKLWIDNIGVSPDYTRRGLGAKLLNKIVTLADENNQEIDLQVRSNNAGAIALYNKVGFKITSTNEPWSQMTRTPQLAAEQQKALTETQRTAAIEVSILEIQSCITLFDSTIISIKDPIPTAHKLLKALQEVFKLYQIELNHSKNASDDIDIASAFKKSCQEAMGDVKKKGLTQKSSYGDTMCNVLSGIINALNHIISIFGKISTKDSSYTFFERKNYVSPKLREALEAVSKIAYLTSEHLKQDIPDSTGFCC